MLNRVRNPKTWECDYQQLEARTVLSGTVFFSDSFENGLAANWQVPQLDSDSRVTIRNLESEGLLSTPPAQQFAEIGNEQSLVFDSLNINDSGSDLGVAILSVDLSSLTTAKLIFHQLEEDDENQSLPDGPHQINEAADGVAISNDGTNWYSILDIVGDDINRSGDGLWRLKEYDLSAEIARLNSEFSAGLALDANFQIKFSQFDNVSYPNDGWAIDELKIVSGPQFFSNSLPQGAFHSFNLAGESEADFSFRVAQFGEVDANTPILVSVHGSGRSIFSHTHMWMRFVADPAKDVSDLVVIAPRFNSGGIHNNFNRLSWNTSNDAAADLTLLEVIDHVASFGVGSSDEFYLFGFSAGGQFTQRFGLAHPDRLAASVVGAPASHAQPLSDVAFQYGISPSSLAPAPAGVEFDPSEFLNSRTMFWVGQDDNDPKHFQLDNSGQAKAQGESRVHRALNTFEMMENLALDNGFAASQYDFEYFVSEGDDHGFDQGDFQTIYEFLMRQPQDSVVNVYGRVVSNPSAIERSGFLPQSVSNVNHDDTVYLELWLDTTQPANFGIESSNLEIYFDTSAVDIVSVQHSSLFSSKTSFVIDEANGRIRNFGGSTNSNGLGVGQFALFGTVELRITESSNRQIAMAIQRGTTDFQLTDGSSAAGNWAAIPRVDVNTSDQGTIFGTVFEHAQIRTSGMRGSNDLGLESRIVKLLDGSNNPVQHTLAIEPDDFDHGRSVTEVSSKIRLSAEGDAVVGSQVTSRDRNTASTGIRVFAGMDASGWNGTWAADRILRIDFLEPTFEVRIDAVAAGTSPDTGMLQVFDINDNLLGTYVTQSLEAGASETMVVASSTSEISYARAFAASGFPRFDNLVVVSEIQSTTNAAGEYIIQDIPAGKYQVVVSPIAGWESTRYRPLIGFGPNTTVSAGSILYNYDFGSYQVPGKPFPNENEDDYQPVFPTVILSDGEYPMVDIFEFYTDGFDEDIEPLSSNQLPLHAHIKLM